MISKSHFIGEHIADIDKYYEFINGTENIQSVL